MKQLQSPQDRTYSICGDPFYSSPEMLQGQGKGQLKLNHSCSTLQTVDFVYCTS